MDSDDEDYIRAEIPAAIPVYAMWACTNPLYEEILQALRAKIRALFMLIVWIPHFCDPRKNGSPGLSNIARSHWNRPKALLTRRNT